MNKKVSGAKSVVVPISSLGKNYLPYVEYLNGRFVKYIDFVVVNSFPNSTDTPVASSDGITLSLAVSSGNAYFVKDEPLKRFDIEENLGIRKPIMQRVSLQNSYLLVADEAAVGKSVLLVFWYDLHEYSSRNTTDEVSTDGWETQIVSLTDKNQMPDNRTMVGKRFRRISVTFQKHLPTYTEGVTYEQARNIFVTLQKGNYRVIDALPLLEFYELGLLQSVDFANIIFDFTNSYLSIGQAASADLVGKSVLLNAVYEDNN